MGGSCHVIWNPDNPEMNPVSREVQRREMVLYFQGFCRSKFQFSKLDLNDFTGKVLFNFTSAILHTSNNEIAHFYQNIMMGNYKQAKIWLLLLLNYWIIRMFHSNSIVIDRKYTEERRKQVTGGYSITPNKKRWLCREILHFDWLGAHEPYYSK